MLLDDFKRHCAESKPDIVVQKFLIEEPAFFFKEVVNGEEYNFKKKIAEKLGVHIRDVLIVGSGKLGFSLKPDRDNIGLYQFKDFDHDPSKKKSDLDVAIVSSNLFDKEIENLYRYMNFYKKDLNLTPTEETPDQYKKEWEQRKSFAFYVLKGRIATRFLPSDCPLSKEIQNVQDKYKMEYGRDVNVEVYKSWYFFETYHQQNIRNIQINLIA